MSWLLNKGFQPVIYKYLIKKKHVYTLKFIRISLFLEKSFKKEMKNSPEKNPIFKLMKFFSYL